MPNIEWVDELPPIDHRTKAARESDAIVRRLKDNPGRWALVVPNAKRRDAERAYKRRGCDTAARASTVGEGLDVFARWPETTIAPLDPYIARRRARGVPTEGRTRP